MSSLGVEPSDLEIFADTFLKSGMPSIDAFLARRGKHRIGTRTIEDIGKAAIAHHLIECEKPDPLHAFPDDHWYEYLWSFMADSLESFGENRLSIITFNYDRSLEYYLMTALQHSFGISWQAAEQHLKKIPIIHVYGQLGVLSESSGADVRSYTNAAKPAYVPIAANGIRVIDESRDDDEVFDEAFSFLCDAQRICFLGFGFDETNVRRLRINELIQDIRARKREAPMFFATTVGLEDAERQKITKLLNPNQSSFGNPTESRIAPYAGFETMKYLRASGALIS